MYSTLGERLCLDSRYTVRVLFALAGIVAVAGSASYLYPGWLMSEPIMLGLCANSAVLAEFHLRVNVRAPRVWNAPPATSNHDLLMDLCWVKTLVGARWLNCCLVFFLMLFYLFFVLMPSGSCFFFFFFFFFLGYFWVGANYAFGDSLSF